MYFEAVLKSWYVIELDEIGLSLKCVIFFPNGSLLSSGIYFCIMFLHYVWDKFCWLSGALVKAIRNPFALLRFSKLTVQHVSICVRLLLETSSSGPSSVAAGILCHLVALCFAMIECDSSPEKSCTNFIIVCSMATLYVLKIYAERGFSTRRTHLEIQVG